MKSMIAMIMAGVLALALHSCGGSREAYVFTSFREPATDGLRYLSSRDGLRWDSVPGTWLRPQLGQGILRDPSVVRSPDGTYHLVWTIAWRGDTGLGYAHSADLLHWSAPRRIGAMDSVPTTQNVWAPELFYDPDGDQYLIVYASCVKAANFALGMEDSANNHRLYYISTRDFASFTPPRLLYDPGFSVIDATIVRRGEADYVMVFKDNTRPERRLRVAFATSATGPWGPPSEPFTERMAEGPTVVRLGKRYIIYYDAYGSRTYRAVSTTDFKTFTDVSHTISVPEGHKHGTIFRGGEIKN